MFIRSKKLIFISLMLLLLSTNFTFAFAQESADKAHPAISWTIGLPFKLIGSTLSGTAGFLVGSTAGFIRGAIKSTRYVAGMLGDENGTLETLAGATFAAIPGGAAHSIAGGLIWLGKGFWIGLEKPLEYPTVRSALEGIPEAIEKTSDEASKIFSSYEES